MGRFTELSAQYESELIERHGVRRTPEEVIRGGIPDVVLDVDSTVIKGEAVDELAYLKGGAVHDEVGRLTNEAMSGKETPESVFFRRLKIINATQEDFDLVALRCASSIVDSAEAVIAAMRDLGRQPRLVSGGYQSIVEEVGRVVGVPNSHIHANHVRFNHNGFARLDPYASPLWTTSGKQTVVRRLADIGATTEQIVIVGDGATDAAVAPYADLFVAFGGVVAREEVMRRSPFAIRGSSLAPVVVIASGERNWTGLMRTEHAPTLREGMERILAGEVDLSGGYEVLPGRIETFIARESWNDRHWNEN